MKHADSLINPFKFDEVKIPRQALGISKMTVMETRAFGRQTGQTQL